MSERVTQEEKDAIAGEFGGGGVERTFEAGARAFKKLMIEASHAAIHPHIEGVYGVFEHKLAATEGI